ncbi:hypothetical protein DPSP01_013362 [Paraphaeosphaeria sporulosa]
MRCCAAGQSPEPSPRLAADRSPPCQQSSDHPRNSMREQPRAGLPLSPGASRPLAAPPALASPFTASIASAHDSPLDQMRWWLRGCAEHHSPFQLNQPTPGHKMRCFSARNPASRHTGLQPPVHPVTLTAGVQTNSTLRKLHGRLQQPQCTSERLGTATAQNYLSQPATNGSMGRYRIDAVARPASATADVQLHQLHSFQPPRPDTSEPSRPADVMLWSFFESNVCQQRYGPYLRD